MDLQKSYKGGKIKFNITVCKKDELDDDVVFAAPENGDVDSEEELIRITEDI